MRRALLVLALLPVVGAAQISKLRHDLEPLAQVKYHADELKEIVSFGYEGGSRFRNFSLAQGAVMAWQYVQVAASRARHGALPGDDDPSSRGKWRDRFWIFKWLGETLFQELTDQGVSMSDYYAMVEEVKQGLAKAGIVVNDPFVRFSDVPKGHWADEAIHSLRRAGVLTGYPDITFRF